MACLRLLTFFPLPDFNVPSLYSCITFSILPLPLVAVFLLAILAIPRRIDRVRSPSVSQRKCSERLLRSRRLPSLGCFHEVTAASSVSSRQVLDANIGDPAGLSIRGAGGDKAAAGHPEQAERASGNRQPPADAKR